MIRFRSDGGMGQVTKLTLKADRDNNGSYETTEHVDTFAVDGSGYVDVQPTYDSAGSRPATRPPT